MPEEKKVNEPSETLPPTPTPPNDLLTQQTSMLAQHQMTTPKSARAAYELPCGFLDEGGNLFTDIAIREITGDEEDILANPKMKPVKKMNELLTRCLERLGPITDRGRLSQAVLDLTVGDRVFLMFAIRRVTLGEDYPFRDKCPNCDAEKIYTVDLSTLDVKPMPDPKRRVFDMSLPSGIGARFHVMTGRDEEKLAKFDKNLADTLSLNLLMRLELLGGKVPILDDVKKLGMRDRTALRDRFDEVEGGVDTHVELVCPDCGHEFDRELDVAQQGFFFPSAIQKNSKRKSST